MHISFLGGAREVGRSCIKVDNFLLDCGIKLGENSVPLIDGFRDIKGVFLTHAHLDHSGYLPFLFSKGFDAPVYGLKPTGELSQVLLSDFIRLQKENERFPEKIDTKDLNEFVKHYKNVEFKHYKINERDVAFYRAGHILGSAMIGINELLYTGDFSLRSSKLVNGAYTKIHPKVLIIESTYADQNFPPQKEIFNNLIESINQTLKSGGKVLIPTFGVGRSQEILFILESYMRSKVLENVPIYIEGMISKANRIFRHNVIYCREEIQKRILMSDDDPFKSRFFKKIPRNKRSRAIKEPCIIVTTNGMITGGPVMDYLKLLGNDPKNKLIIVGYQAEGTNGRKLLEGERVVYDKIKQIEIPVQMAVELHHLSSHADRQQIIHFIGEVKPKKVFFVHGEEKKALEIAKYFEEKSKSEITKDLEVYVPKIGEEFEV